MLIQCCRLWMLMVIVYCACGTHGAKVLNGMAIGAASLPCGANIRVYPNDFERRMRMTDSSGSHGMTSKRNSTPSLSVPVPCALKGSSRHIVAHLSLAASL